MCFFFLEKESVQIIEQVERVKTGNEFGHVDIFSPILAKNSLTKTLFDKMFPA